MNPVLNIAEDKDRIKSIINSYLSQNTILDWKYELALMELIDKNLLMEPTEENMKHLGDMYLEEVSIVYESRRDECTSEESSKVDIINNNSFFKICTSPQIHKLLRLAVYSAQALNEAIDNRILTAENSQTSKEDDFEFRNFQNLSIDEQMIFLCDKFGNQGHLDLTTTIIAKRFRKPIKEFGLKLQPTLTRKERDVLLEVSRCTDITSVNKLLAKLYSNMNMNQMCRYIRLALSNMVELWSSDSLVTADHNESWYRTHIYGPVFDNAFIYDKKFITKRADCVSNITKEFDDIANQRVDFILRNLNDDTDYLSAEEKSGPKGVKKDIDKGKALQMAMLRKWIQYVGNSRISNLEAITCQWQGVKLQINGTKYISQSHSISYNKGVFVVPKILNNLASFAQTLAAVLSLKHLVYLNYRKINIILETKRQYDMEFMHFQGSEIDDITFRSDSTAGYDSINSEKIIDFDLEESITEALENIKQDNDIVTVKDWEEFVIKKVANKKRKLA